MKQLIILSGMSGVGKDTVSNILLSLNPQINRVKTCTTREKRRESGGELDDSYYYLTETEFKQKIKARYFLEWAKVHRYYYGSPLDEVKSIWEQNKIPFLVIDVQGLESVNKIFPDELISIFLEYDPDTDIKERLTARRPGITEEELQSRVDSAEKEKIASINYQHHVINYESKPEQAAEEVNKIITNS